MKSRRTKQSCQFVLALSYWWIGEPHLPIMFPHMLTMFLHMLTTRKKVLYVLIHVLTNQHIRRGRNSMADLKGMPALWLPVYHETSTERATISKKTLTR